MDAVGESQITYDARGLVEPDETVPGVSVIEDGKATFDAAELTTRKVNLELRSLIYEQGIDDVLVTVGGTIPADDIPELKELGVAEVFTPGTPTQAIIDFISGSVQEREPR